MTEKELGFGEFAQKCVNLMCTLDLKKGMVIVSHIQKVRRTEYSAGISLQLL